MSEFKDGLMPEPKPEQSENIGKKIFLLTPDQLASLPDGTVLINFFGETKIKGQDELSSNTRAGLLEYGFLEADKPADIDFRPDGEWTIQEKPVKHTG